MQFDEPAVANPPKPVTQGSARTGIAWMILCTLLFVSQDATIRILTRNYPVLEVVWARFAVHFAIAAAIVAWRSPRLMRSRHPVLQIVRSALLFGVAIFITLAMRVLPFAEVQSVGAVAPVLVTALSVPLLGEKVGWRRWIGVFGGLTGAMVIIGPANGTFHWTVGLPLGAALCNALYQICTRKLRDDPPATTMFYTGLAGTAAGTVLLPFNWVTPDLTGTALMAVLGGLGLVSHLCLVRAYAVASAATIAPFGYTTLVWSALFAVILFGEVLSLSTLAGGAIIVVSGIYIFHREQSRKRG